MSAARFGRLGILGGGGSRSGNASDSRSGNGGGHDDFECNICLDHVTEPVVSLCGHLFCWPCVHCWMVARPEEPSCPVCKAPISEAAMIPVYGRADRDSAAGGGASVPVPPRPHARRERRHRLGGLHISIGIDPSLSRGGGLSLTGLAIELQEALVQLEFAELLGPLASQAFLLVAIVLGLWLLFV